MKSKVFLEVGIGNGEFIVWAAKKDPQSTFVGVEVCKKVFRDAQKRVAKAGVKNVKLFLMEGTRALCQLFKEESLSGVYLNFPDPWAKKKQKKRRFINKASVWLIASRLKIEGFFIMATDFKEYAEETVELFSATGAFSPLWNTPIRNELPGYYLTKYARKWLFQGLPLYFVGLKKVKNCEIPGWLYSYYPLLKLKGGENLPEVVLSLNKKADFEKLGENLPRGILWKEEFLVVKLLEMYSKKDGLLLDMLVSEGEFVQRFFVKIAPHSEGLILKIHEATSAEPTEGVHLAMAIVARLCEKFLNARIERSSCKKKVWQKLEGRY